MSSNRERSLSTSQSDSTSLYSTFLSRFKQPTNDTPLPSVNVIPSKSVSAMTSTSLYYSRRPAPSHSTVSGRKKYEAVLGVKAEEIFSENTLKKNNNSSKFGSLFRKKKTKPVLNETFHTRPHTPPEQLAVNEIIIEEPNYPQDIIITTDNALSARKSTGSCSIYSTFGPESVYTENKSNDSLQSSPPPEHNVMEDDTDDDDDDDDDEDDDEEIKEKREMKLSNRLSGGHFGSAGGLLQSIIEQRTIPPPEDVANSMINWKRRSGGKHISQEQDNSAPPIQQANTFPVKQKQQQPLAQPPSSSIRYAVPKRSLPPHPDIAITEEEVENENSIDSKECATRLWHEDDSFVQREQIAEWLGQSKPLNMDTLQEYMAFFDFSKLRLDSAFRKVCSKLYFRAEAQQIDRILEAFAKRYWQCNPKSTFGSADIVYAVVYSLLLLNTDLHVAQGNYTRMTRQEFVRNTMSTIKDQKKTELETSPKSESYMIAWESHVESYLKDMYVSVKNNQILQPRQNEQDDLSNTNTATTASRRMSMIAGKRMIDIKRSLNTMIHKSTSARESMLFPDDSVLPRKSTSSSNQPTTPRESFTSNSPAPTPRSFTMPSPAPTHMSGSNSPYLKEGIVMRKHLLESKNHKARHREWRECLLIVRQGEFKLYGLPYDMDTLKLLKGGNSFVNLADSMSKVQTRETSSIASKDDFPATSNNKWAAYTQFIGTVNLCHTLSNALPPPGYNRSKPFVFALQESNGGVNLIQSTSHEQINEWVETCNYWAARQSKEPLQGGVGNVEYGWGNCLNDVTLNADESGDYVHNPDSVNLSVWTPPAPSLVASVLDEEAQLESIQRYVDQLNEEINEHREIKKKILVKFQHKSQNQARALSNWEAKSTYMLHEIIKYQNYCNALEKSIKEKA